MSYVANTPAQRAAMLDAIGKSTDDLFAVIRPELRPRSFDLPEARSELEVRQMLGRLAAEGRHGLVSFLGSGVYDHFIPAAVDSILSRAEFYTAYTPYQPEASQGTLQAIYEFQSAVCRLTGMEVANASLYDGGTALYEAAMMALRHTGRRKIVLDEAVNPIYRNMLRSHTAYLSVECCEFSGGAGRTDRSHMAQLLDRTTAAVIVQNPNFFGCVDDFTDVTEMAHENGALLIVSCYPLSLGCLKTPGEMGADIVTAEGQCLGLPLSFGGPYLGIMATRRKLVRKMPGRVVGRTKDSAGREGFVLSLQAREQHIRRAKATSNICTNESLCALGALVYLTLIGKQGLVDVARLCASKAAYARRRLLAIPGVSARFDAPVFNEFVIDLPRPAADVIGRLIEHGFAAGFPLGRYYRDMDNSILIAVTEKRTMEEIDALVRTLESVL
ncbi:MAG: aminomethyl-transferring glycine dehydrogenase subunit GcvPA [Candidatus Brocadiia bacterium]|jgi:glycine dehydrogenase subunit 1|nr:aminomethyl-transferring glycine dehydrogenase subunit GcvPA [Candidatus Brocadiia bacterium]